MNKRLLQFLSVCYRYNKHYNISNRIYINVIGTKNAIIIYKQRIKNRYMIKGFETNLELSKVMETIKEFFNHVPYNPEVFAVDFDTFSEFLQSYYPDNKELNYII